MCLCYNVSIKKQDYKKALEIDSEAMKKISPNDKKRILRVLEIYKATGKTKTEQEVKCVPTKKGAMHDERITHSQTASL